MSKLEEILPDRKKTHGPWSANANTSQHLKRVLLGGGNGIRLDPYQAEALEMICHKLARIVHGDPYFKDHWMDIAGYATRVVEELEKRS